MEMNYFDLIFIGYCNPTDQNNLSNYFFREYKKAELNYYSIESFFGGCIVAIETLESELMDKVNKRKENLYLMLNRAKNKTSVFQQLDPNKSYEQQCIETIEYCESELKELSIDTFAVSIGQWTKKCSGSFTGGKLQYIKDAIIDAKNQISDEIGKMTAKSNNPTKMKNDFSDYLKHPDPEKLITELKSIFPDAKGKNAALMITALIENGITEKPTNNIDITRAIKKEWNIDFSDESFNRPFRNLERDKSTGYKGEAIAAINKVKKLVI